MALAPITEEDRPAIESMIKKLKRYRKREAEQQSRNYGTPTLDDAISGLMQYGSDKGWWEFDPY